MKKRSNRLELTKLFAALADPTRLRLLNMMSGREVCVCYFVAVLRQAQPKISRHLAYLRSAGIVRARREGKWMHYRIRWPEDGAASAILKAALAALAANKEMQADLARLERACCDPEKVIVQVGAPFPASVS
jgi:ArsR family transcriptional regulator, arsenate/arsenite/antimonite-responsive transcriptional repressor